MPLGERPAGQRPYLWLDATYLKSRKGGRIASVAVIVAVAVNTDGRREVLTGDARLTGPRTVDIGGNWQRVVLDHDDPLTSIR